MKPFRFYLPVMVIFITTAWLSACAADMTLAPIEDPLDHEVNAAFKEWAEWNGQPYRDVTTEILSNDGYFAYTLITAWFRIASDADWMEMETAIECRLVGDNWQCSRDMLFIVTKNERARQDMTATVVAIPTLTAEAVAVETAQFRATERAVAFATTQIQAIHTIEARQTATRAAVADEIATAQAKVTPDIAPEVNETAQGIAFVFEPAALRRAPFGESDIVMRVDNETPVEIFGINEDGSWLLIRVPSADDAVGWIFRDLIFTTDRLNGIPVYSPEDDTAPIGRILYSVTSINSGRSRIFSQPVEGGAPEVFAEDGVQPAQRADGKRIVYKNTRDDTAGISAFDPASGLMLGFTTSPDDRYPSWNPAGDQIVFTGEREDDALPHIYVGRAEVDSEVTPLGPGTLASWHPSEDTIVFWSCDGAGDACGLWTMSSFGTYRTALTSVPEDSHPNWSPDGNYVAFTSDGRDGNHEIYRVNVNSGAVLRLTDHAADDVVPTVSPDGRWVAFLSNRDGPWKLLAVPIQGGDVVEIGELAGSFGDWREQKIQWVE